MFESAILMIGPIDEDKVKCYFFKKFWLKGGYLVLVWQMKHLGEHCAPNASTDHF